MIGLSLVDPWICIEGNNRSAVIAAGDRVVAMRALKAGFFVIDKGTNLAMAVFPSGVDYGA